jgi:hypothetical protein
VNYFIGKKVTDKSVHFVCEITKGHTQVIYNDRETRFHKVAPPKVTILKRDYMLTKTRTVKNKLRSRSHQKHAEVTATIMRS